MKRLLIIAVCFLALALPCSAEAGTVRRSQHNAIQWVLDLVSSNWGNTDGTYNFDGSQWAVGDYGEPQCVDLVKYYSDYLVGTYSYMNGVNAYSFGNLTLPDGLVYTDSPEPGDIFVKTDGQFGHVGIVVKIEGDQYYSVDTNGGGIAGYDSLGRRINEGATQRGPNSISSVSTFIHPLFDKTPPEIYTTLDVYDISSEGFTISFYATDNVGIEKVYAVVKPTPVLGESSVPSQTAYGTIDLNTNKATIRVDIDDDIGYLGESYRVTCYVEDAAENGALYPNRGKLVNLYKIDTTDAGNYKAIRDTIVHSAPRNTVNGYSTSSYDLNKNDKIEDVWGSYTENGKKWLRFGKSKWVVADDAEKTGSSSYVLSALKEWSNSIIYLINGYPVYASEHVDDPVEIEGTQFRWVRSLPYVPTNDTTYEVGETYTWMDNTPFTVSVVEIDGMMGLSIDAYHGNDDNLEVPASIAWMPVLAISNNAFAGDNDLISVTIPGSVKEIGGSAFEDCYGLESVSLSEGLETIEDYAFRHCWGLNSINIPNSLKTVGDQAFYGSGGEMDLTLHDEIENIGYEAFEGFGVVRCHAGSTTAKGLYRSFVSLTNDDYWIYQTSDDALTVSYRGTSTEAIVPSAIDGIAVVYIGGRAFYANDELLSVTIPGSVKEIGGSAFEDCYALKSVSLSEGLETIEDYAFRHCWELKSVVIPNSINRIGSQSFYAGLSTIYGYAGTRAESYAAEESIRFIPIDGSTLPSFDFVIPSSTTAIAEEAFSGIPAKSVKLGSQVSSIGKLAFAECSSMEVIYIPSSVDSIAGDAFSGVKGLVIFGQSDSRAESFAREKGYVFIAVG